MCNMQQRYRSIIVSSENTDVRILCLAFSFSSDVAIYQRCVSQINARYVDMEKIAHVIGQDAYKALPGLHAFTGCDAVSAFAGIGKVKPLKKLLSKKEYQRTFQQRGENWLMSEDLLMQLEAFVWDIYGAKKGISDVNQCRYAVFCAKKGEAESHQLPPCQDSLYNGLFTPALFYMEYTELLAKSHILVYYRFLLLMQNSRLHDTLKLL